MQGSRGMIISISVVIVFVGILLIYYFGATHKEFESLDPKSEFGIPGLDDAYVPQGVEYIEQADLFLMSGYMSDGSASRLYVINHKTGESRYVTIKHNGNDFLGHMGGVSSDGTFVWIAGDKSVITLRLEEVLNSNSVVEQIAESVTGNGCDWVSWVNGKLLVGEFYRKNKYETPGFHHIGETSAVGYIYSVDHSQVAGFDVSKVECAVTLPDNAQGLVVVGDKIVVSTSWAIPKSKLFVYDNVFNKSSIVTLNILGTRVPLYELNSSNLLNTIKAPAMSEEMVLVGDRIFICFESACKKYKFINRTRTKSIISIGVENL